jgi:hypothetical protein
MCFQQVGQGDAFEDWADLVQRTRLTKEEQDLLIGRVVRSAHKLKLRVSRLWKTYFVSKTIVTLGSILIPSIGALNDNTTGRTMLIYWMVWTIGLTISFSNASIALFGIDRKYFLMKSQLALLESEAWLYIAHAGPYKTLLLVDLGHSEHLVCFVEKCERIIHVAAMVEGKHTPTNQDHLGTITPSRSQVQSPIHSDDISANTGVNDIL